MSNPHDEQLPPLGDGSMNMPYESNPTPFEADLQAHVAGGLVIIAGAIPVDDIWRACLVFRFAIPDGSGFYPDMVLIAEGHELKAVASLASDAAGDAIAEAYKRRRQAARAAEQAAATEAERCDHGEPLDEHCPRCTNAEEVGRPVGGGPHAATTIVARRNSNCARCSRLIIAHQDHTAKLDEGWCCEPCATGGAG